VEPDNLKKRILKIITFLLICPAVKAEERAEPEKLSLQKCIDLVLKNNPEIKLEYFNPQLKELDLKKISDEFGLSIGFRPGVQNSIRPVANSFIAGGAVLREFNQNYDFFVRKKLFSNGEVSIDFQNDFLNTNSTRVDLNPAITPRLNLSFNQPLLKNAMNGFRRIGIGKTENELAELKLKNVVIETINKVQNAYWEVFLNREKINILKENFNLGKQLIEINQEKQKKGLISEIEVLNTEATLMLREEYLLQGQKKLQESEDRLKMLLGNNFGWEQKLLLTDSPDYLKPETDYQKSFENALKYRPDYLTLLSERKNLFLQSEIAAQNRLPDLTLNGGFGLTTLNNNYLTALSKIFSLETYSWNLALNLELPVSGNIAETEYNQTEVRKERHESLIKNFQQNLAGELRNSFRNLEIAEKRIKSAEIAKKLLNEQLKAETEKFRLGMSTNFQVLQLQNNLQEAALNELNARIDYLNAKNLLFRAEGTLLEKNKIVWETASFEAVK